MNSLVKKPLSAILRNRILDVKYRIFGKKFAVPLAEWSSAKLFIHNMISLNAYKVTENNRPVQKSEYLNYEIAETKLFRILSESSHTLFDIGGHIGYYSILFASINRDNNVVAFEVLDNFACEIKFQAKRNRYSNIHVITDPVGNGDDSIEFGNFFERRKAKTVCLDTFVAEKNLTPDLVKFDIEGFESIALANFTETLRASQPKMLFGYHPKFIRQLGADPIQTLSLLLDIYDHVFHVIDSVELSLSRVNASDYSLPDVCTLLAISHGDLSDSLRVFEI